MPKLIFALLLLECYFAEAQESSGKRAFLQFLRTKNPSFNYQWARQSPRLITLCFPNQPAAQYWQGASYISYSENGRVQSTHSFDIHGQLRETRTSISLKKNGVLSSWRLQFSSQRTRLYLCSGSGNTGLSDHPKMNRQKTPVSGG